MTQSKEIILFCHSSCQNLGQQIAASSDVEKGRLNIVLKMDILWKKFPDGFPNLFIQNIHSCLGKNVAFLGSFHSPLTIFEQISLVYSLARYPIKSLTFILPYFPTGTMERVDEEGQVATAMSMARIISATPLTMMGPSKIMIFDIHALQERFFFTDNVTPQLCSALPNFLSELETLDCVTIAFPDEGAHKRFSRYFPNHSIIRCIKRRQGKKREVTIVDGKPQDQHVVIVDDLVMTGGTLLECITTLKQAGASRVSAYVTHAVFPQESWRCFTNEESEVLSTFWITDSIPHAVEISKHPPFKLLSLASSIKSTLEQQTFA